MFIKFHPLINIFIQVAILIHKYFFQIDDLQCICGIWIKYILQKVHKDAKREPL
jgi:hypothetical protein